MFDSIFSFMKPIHYAAILVYQENSITYFKQFARQLMTSKAPTYVPDGSTKVSLYKNNGKCFSLYTVTSWSHTHQAHYVQK